MSVAAARLHITGFFLPSFLSLLKSHSPDSPLEERSDWDLDCDLFFFLWYSSSSDSEPWWRQQHNESSHVSPALAAVAALMQEEARRGLTDRERDRFLWCFLDFLECFFVLEWWCWHSCCGGRRKRRFVTVLAHQDWKVMLPLRMQTNLQDVHEVFEYPLPLGLQGHVLKGRFLQESLSYLESSRKEAVRCRILCLNQGPVFLTQALTWSCESSRSTHRLPAHLRLQGGRGLLQHVLESGFFPLHLAGFLLFALALSGLCLLQELHATKN